MVASPTRLSSPATLRLALLAPDIAGNVGTLMRLAACLGVALDLIEPLGFPFSDKKLARAGLDYADLAQVTRHADWPAFLECLPGRLIAIETSAAVRLDAAAFLPGDTLLLGAESSGLPDWALARADLAVRLPMLAGRRSLNVAIAAAMTLSEALRQVNGWPSEG
ncbi:MAG: rRNA methyltransferase [Proteobacteria bacterium SG_bin6]|nr:MAG: rRNA methyltransferase [Proteobacteria bacterium SG_bin6]